MTWCNAEFHLHDREHPRRATGGTSRRVRTVLAHFMVGDVAACGWRPNESTRMLPEDASAWGAMRCERCTESRGR